MPAGRRPVVAKILPRHIPVLACLVLGILVVANVRVLWSPEAYTVLFAQWLPSSGGDSEQRVGDHVWHTARGPIPHASHDNHPIKDLFKQADTEFGRYDSGRSKTFKQAVAKYRETYGRHPPPGYKEWYKFARRRHVYNIDDFQQIHDDLRPFWSISPVDLRRLAAHASDEDGYGIAPISVRDGLVIQKNYGWRSETLIDLIGGFSKWLPDMDLAMNQMDQSRVIVQWDDLQAALAIEEESRLMVEEGVADSFTKHMDGLRSTSIEEEAVTWLRRLKPFGHSTKRSEDEQEQEEQVDYGWFHRPGGQFMDLAALACPPESHARNMDWSHSKKAEESYKHGHGFVSNFNLSSDLCTVGPQIHNLHGFLYASSSLQVTQKLVPVFSECKVNVNNDILFPANMYWKKDPRYHYDDSLDIEWEDKDDIMIWRGVTSGGTGTADPWHWRTMHRHRLVLLTNSTELTMNHNTSSILAPKDSNRQIYEPYSFKPAAFADEHTDVGFTEKIACFPNCDFYDSFLKMVNSMTFTETFMSKYLVDVDGHSFSGRWRAFLQSHSVGLKATIFREWHDSRLFAWRHFIPMDNRYDDLYSLLTYFIGTYSNRHSEHEVDSDDVRIESHDSEAKLLADQGRAWAAKVLRNEDIEIYTFRLLLEYGRLIDDNRDHVGVTGDGGKEMEKFDRQYPAVD